MNPQDLSSDIISTLPPSIIESILCRVLIKEAARTSILSSEWRYKWTKIPKLVFSEYMFRKSTEVFDSEDTMASERKTMGERCKLFSAIYQVLLMRQGPVHEFTLYLTVDETCTEIDHIISYLSRNNSLKKLKLDLFDEQYDNCRLPFSIFSLHHLTDLHLCECDLNVQPTLSGFPRLTKLYLKNVYISMKTLLHIVSSSPGLEHFTLIIDKQHIIGDANSTVIELFTCLPLIEHLSTHGWITECFVVDSVPQGLPTLLIHLKYFYMDSMSFASADQLRFLALLIRCSPNLEKITLDIDTDSVDNELVSVIRESYSDIWLEHLKELKIDRFSNSKSELEFVKFILAKSPKLEKLDIDAEYYDDETVSFIRESYSDIWLEHLNELKIEHLGNSMSELEFVKYILAKSPKLKKVELYTVLDENEESEMLRILLEIPPASTVVEFILR